MTTRTVVHESLPYVDKEPTADERTQAQTLITAELASIQAEDDDATSTSTSTSLHPSLPPLQDSSFYANNPLLQEEQARLLAKQKLTAIDLSRYQIDDDDLPANPTTEQLESALSRAYTAQAYLTARHAHLGLLDRYGKNSWLVGNWQAEAELASLERDLAATKRDIELVNHARRQMQTEVGEELRGLDATWRRGVGRVLETEVAVERLRHDIEQRRQAAETGGNAVEE
ncbi:Pre-mRNA-splicing factor SPF27 [Apiospora arundinis]|uniref:Pre-mRNA-splicing factor SPF27 n=1 Tax=Apiospora arundinis TaxID=335852 RepID=A0ABR2JAU3_9PEZI